MKKLIVTVMLGLGLVACGGSNTQCQSAMCQGGSTKTYQACATSGSTTVTYNYGGSSCSCDTSNTMSQMCMTCLQAVATYCTM